MMDVQKVEGWFKDRREIALATVIQTWGSSPRPAGSKMLITSEGEIAGSVSGGCVESAVVEVGMQVIEEGVPLKTHFGVADETAWEVGLACGGELDVFIKPLRKSDVNRWKTAREVEGPYCEVMVIEGPEEFVGREMVVLAEGEVVGQPLGSGADRRIRQQARQAIAERRTQLAEISSPEADADMVCFFHVHLPQPTLVAVGGVHIAIPLMAIARTLNYRTVVIDPRKMFATQDRFPDVDLLLPSWPEEAFQAFQVDEYTAVAMLTHDPKIDDPALQFALDSAAFYVGALGSEKTQQDRRQRLRASGVSEEKLARLHAPIGLDLGGRDPEEIALAVMAEIVQERNRKD